MIGSYVPVELTVQALERAGYACERCGKAANHKDHHRSYMGLCVHHKNGWWMDNWLENLQVLCKPCHHAVHGEEATERAVQERRMAFQRIEQGCPRKWDICYVSGHPAKKSRLYARLAEEGLLRKPVAPPFAHPPAPGGDQKP